MVLEVWVGVCFSEVSLVGDSGGGWLKQRAAAGEEGGAGGVGGVGGVEAEDGVASKQTLLDGGLESSSGGRVLLTGTGTRETSPCCWFQRL